jgi:5-methylcytosine-specific restriction endonuclease McrA
VILDPNRLRAPRDSIRPLARPPSEAPPALDLFALAPESPTSATAAGSPKTGEVSLGSMMEPPAVADVSTKAAPLRHLIKMTVGPEFLARLEEVRAELSHSHSGASLETLLLECMKVTLATRRKRSRAQADRPRSNHVSQAKADSRLVPAHVRREVWARDQGRCTFLGDDGRRCDATHRLELHHEIPFARGGSATAANLRILCQPHNLLLARRDYGDAHVDRCIQAR